MATLTLKGKLIDLTTKPVEDVTNVTVKAPAPNAASMGTITTQPRKVDLSSDGSFSLTVAEGTGWLFVEGPGWSDSIRFVAKAGMTLFEQARLNAGPWPIPLPLAEDAADLITNSLQDALNAIAGASAQGLSTIPNGTDWDSLLTHGTYLRPSGNVNDVNAPNSSIGALYVSEPRRGLSSDGYQSQFFVGYADTGIWFRALASNGNWTAWRRIDESYVDYLRSSERVIPAGTDINEFTGPMVGVVPANAEGIGNLPIFAPGILTVYDTQNSTGNIQTQSFLATNPPRLFLRDRNSAGYWQPWREVGFHDVAHIDPGAGHREAVVDYGLFKRGRVIGTGGLPAIALRFDHHLDSFGTKVLPLLKKYRLPWGQMLNAGRVGKGDDNWSWEKVAQECHVSGGEVWNHSWSHSDIAHHGAADREVTRGLSDLVSKLPTLHIDSWAGPGQPNLMGMEGSESPERFYDTYPGRLVLAQHAFIRGYYLGVYHPLNGANLIGAPHVTIDSQPYSWCDAFIRGLINAKSGATIMLHPNYLDQAGYMTTADLEKVLANVAAKRDAGELMVLSCSGVLMADSSRSVADSNLLEHAGAGVVESSRAWILNSRKANDNFGVTHEASAWVKAKSSGNVTLKVKVESPTHPVDVSHTLRMTVGQVARLTVVVTPPLDTTRQVVTVSGGVTHTGVVYRPI